MIWRWLAALVEHSADRLAGDWHEDGPDEFLSRLDKMDGLRRREET